MFCKPRTKAEHITDIENTQYLWCWGDKNCRILLATRTTIWNHGKNKNKKTKSHNELVHGILDRQISWQKKKLLQNIYKSESYTTV